MTDAIFGRRGNEKGSIFDFFHCIDGTLSCYRSIKEYLENEIAIPAIPLCLHFYSNLE